MCTVFYLKFTFNFFSSGLLELHNIHALMPISFIIKGILMCTRLSHGTCFTLCTLHFNLLLKEISGGAIYLIIIKVTHSTGAVRISIC